MDRIYTKVIENHFAHYAQMAFVTGPRQVGKTTVSKFICDQTEYAKYLNWDITKDRALILDSEEKIVEGLPVDAVLTEKPYLILDEIHKYKQWKNYLKGFIDQYKERLNIIVTGSAKLDVIRKGGDSLMGRYFLYRVHPLSVRELLNQNIQTNVIQIPQKIDEEQFDALLQYGGFPEPFLKQSNQFYYRWQSLRQEQMLREDIQNSEQIQDLAQLELLAELLKHQATKQTEYAELAKKIRVADSTIRRWLKILESYYYCFALKPWSRNIPRSLLKQPKVFLWDWSILEDKGAKIENFVACHLFKAVHFWSDMGLGKFELYFIRDKDKKEVDFVVTKNNKPWILIEVKSSGKTKLSEHLVEFQQQTKAEYAFQLAYDLPYVDKDCFKQKHPCIVSMKTFLSQLV